MPILQICFMVVSLLVGVIGIIFWAASMDCFKDLSRPYTYNVDFITKKHPVFDMFISLFFAIGVYFEWLPLYFVFFAIQSMKTVSWSIVYRSKMLRSFRLERENPSEVLAEDKEKLKLFRTLYSFSCLILAIEAILFFIRMI